MTGVAVQLTEWETSKPEPGSPLRGVNLPPEARIVADELSRSRKLEVLQLVDGVGLRAFSWVGRIELGKITVTVKPKISHAPFLNLLRYAYGLRQLTVKDDALYETEQGTFQDLIARQLASEVEELIARGLHRDYRRESAELAVPRGRIDFQRYVLSAGMSRASLPCVYHPRTQDTVLNRVLLAGTELGVLATSDTDLRGHLRRLGQALNLDATAPRLQSELLHRAWQSTDRRTRSYEPALTLIGLLLQGLGISLDEDHATHRLQGFLFDMNRFFQALMSRFLRENLPGYSVRDEHWLKGMFEFGPSGNPRSRRTPKLRPDFIVLSKNKIVSVLDAKYRDLWEHNLPRDMLYQLAMYALGHGGSNPQAIILYPTLESNAIDQVIVLRDPVHGCEQAQIVLRPVALLELNKHIYAPYGVERERRCRAMAARLAFGCSDATEAH